jgi:S-adenosylmethionine:tRNA ribosyltransferase-isomerase
MKIADFDYDLPPGQIAQQPLESRDASRMLLVNRTTAEWRDRMFTEFPTCLRRGDALVLNNTRVFPARLVGRREGTGGKVELFLIREVENGLWEALAKPARRLQAGAKVMFEDNQTSATIVEALDEGHRLVRFESPLSVNDAVDHIGRTPLPPYIKRDQSSAGEDRERYQTVYARSRGAIAAPTAGLHFTPELLQDVRDRGVTIVEITLHVGYGTFEPVRAEDLSDHRVSPERFEISQDAVDILNACRREGGRIFAVGTTTTRALETIAEPDGEFRAYAGSTSLTITPGYIFRGVDAILTNFHLPRSSLLVLTASFAGYELTMKTYNHAVAAGYRFYSYGDCMLII